MPDTTPSVPSPKVDLSQPGLADFVSHQRQNFGGNVEIGEGIWALFALPATDADGIALARQILTGAPFTHDSGPNEDDQWTLFFVGTDDRATAIHWLEDVQRQLEGRLRLPSPAQIALLRQIVESTMPHRIAQSLVDQHTRGELSAGAFRDPAQLRALLDRLHMGEPLFYSAFQLLLTNHTIDLVVLLEQLIPEDIDHANETVRGSLSRDPFLRSRQTTAADIRSHFTRFHLINTLDQQKNTAIRNPYAAYFDLVKQADKLSITIDGTTVPTSCETFIRAIHSTRRNLYRGGDFSRFDTQVPWMQDDIAYSFRFIKQRLDQHRELTPLDGLFMLERAVES